MPVGHIWYVHVQEFYWENPRYIVVWKINYMITYIVKIDDSYVKFFILCPNGDR